MTKYNEPEWQTREKTMASIAFGIREYKGNLELRTSNTEIGLFGQNDETFFKRSVLDEGLSGEDGLNTIEDLISATKREGYSPSLFNRFLLNFFPYIPNKISLIKH